MLEICEMCPVVSVRKFRWNNRSAAVGELTGGPFLPFPGDWRLARIKGDAVSFFDYLVSLNSQKLFIRQRPGT